jgi:phosphoribosylformimino-5-aminoimidazole carboxamide ribotide isomerase
MSMEVIPAIDLKDGACVRLYQGDFDRETVFSRDPVDMALRWQSAGALRIHVVDLDGSRTGR